jgi:hypothetical protein
MFTRWHGFTDFGKETMYRRGHDQDGPSTLSDFYNIMELDLWLRLGRVPNCSSGVGGACVRDAELATRLAFRTKVLIKRPSQMSIANALSPTRSEYDNAHLGVSRSRFNRRSRIRPAFVVEFDTIGKRLASGKKQCNSLWNARIPRKMHRYCRVVSAPLTRLVSDRQSHQLQRNLLLRIHP